MLIGIGKLREGQVYELANNTYKDSDEELYMDIVVPRMGVLRGFYAYRFAMYDNTMTSVDVLGLFK